MAEINFSQLNGELEDILLDLQSGDKDIDVVIKKYERGIDLIGKLEKYLAGAENKIKKLKPKDAI
jgi:exodeoxyribonuclease VII small subunit